MSGDRSDRFVWQPGDLVLVGEEPQPLDVPSLLTQPPLPDGSMTGAKFETAVRDLAEWLRQEAEKGQDEVLISEFVASQKVAAETDEQHLLEAIDQMPTIFEDEKAALLVGNRDRLLGKPKAWQGVAECLKKGQASGEFLAALAVLIECNVFQRRAKVSVEKTAEMVLQARKTAYEEIIEKAYAPGPNQAERWAKAAVAHEEMREGETLAKAEARVAHDMRRNDKAMKTKATIAAAIERAARCRAVPRP